MPESESSNFNLPRFISKEDFREAHLNLTVDALKNFFTLIEFLKDNPHFESLSLVNKNNHIPEIAFFKLSDHFFEDETKTSYTNSQNLTAMFSILCQCHPSWQSIDLSDNHFNADERC